MLLGPLTASILGNALTRKVVNREREGTSRTD